MVEIGSNLEGGGDEEEQRLDGYLQVFNNQNPM